MHQHLVSLVSSSHFLSFSIQFISMHLHLTDHNANYVKFLFITTRIRRMRKVMVSQVCARSTLGEGVPQSQVLSQVSGSRSFLGGYPSPRWGLPQSQVGVTSVLAGGNPVPSGRYPSHRWGSTPQPGQGWGTPPPSQDRTGVPPQPGEDRGTPPAPHRQDRTGVPTPSPGQQNQYLLCGGWYASYGHEGGLSCFF